MRLGKAAMEALQAEISGLLTPGNELVVAGAIALYGTAQIAAGGSYQIKHNGYVETGSDFQRFRHGFHTCISDISKIQCQCMRVSGDLSYFCRMFCHDRAASGRQNNIRTVMNRNRISDAVNQRLCCSGQLSGICLIYGHILDRKSVV